MRGRRSSLLLLFQTVILLCGQRFGAASRSLQRSEEKDLIGWQGETHFGGDPSLKPLPTLVDRTPWIETVAWSPRAFVYHNFLSPSECLHMIHSAAPKMRKSSVVDNKTGKSIDSNIRTSSGTFLKRKSDKIITAIEERIADFSMVPMDNGEGLQILHYEESQKYEAHYDYFHDAENVKNGGQRAATVLMYLTDVEEGGETVFPNSQFISARTPEEEASLSPCARKGVAVKPKRGSALLFWSISPSGELDPHSLHAGCPVIKGDKWSATKWMRVNNYKM